jgi:hypothetical protein
MELLEFYPDPDNSQYNTYQSLYIYSEYLLMMGNKDARNK